ncbi:prevent-host-death protein [Campylobacter devanensis]|uniref:prevent-host-death protein n=1 Tax=Campylobacter devanensis TaxID=3161138 RepID=UPI000A32B3D4|nr:prevent-host-death protein [Campylobacter sp. P0227]
MAKFSKDEIYTATQMVRNFSSILNDISQAKKKRAFIVKNNRFEAVMINMEEYERLSEAVTLLETIYNRKKES